MEINRPEIVAEVEAAFAAYEAALVGNDVEALDALFWAGPHTIRYGATENLYGAEEIAAFRAARSPAGLGRRLRVTATAPDGLPEAIEVPGRCLALGLQWHPERGGGRELADALVAAAAAWAASVEPSTAIPQSDFFREGASLTPSPVMAVK